MMHGMAKPKCYICLILSKEYGKKVKKEKENHPFWRLTWITLNRTLILHLLHFLFLFLLHYHHHRSITFLSFLYGFISHFSTHVDDVKNILFAGENTVLTNFYCTSWFNMFRFRVSRVWHLSNYPKKKTIFWYTQVSSTQNCRD